MQERERELERDFIFYHLIAFDIERERKREKKSILYPYKFRKTDENVAGNIVENIHDKISLFLGLIYPRNILPLLFFFYFFFFIYIHFSLIQRATYCPYRILCVLGTELSQLLLQGLSYVRKLSMLFRNCLHV